MKRPKHKLSEQFIKSLKPEKSRYEINDTECTGLSLRVNPSASKVYYGRFYMPDGTQKRVAIGSTDLFSPKSAREYLLDVKAEAKKGVDPVQKRKDARQYNDTLEEYLEVYREWLVVHKKGDLRNYNRIKGSFKSLLKKKMSKLSRLEFDRWRANRLKDSGDGVNINTVNRDIAALSPVLDMAVKDRKLEVNHLKEIDRIKSEDNSRVRYLTIDERPRFYKAIADRNIRKRAERDKGNNWREERGYDQRPDLNEQSFVDHLEPMILVSIKTGLRRGELFKLTWANVDLERRQLKVVRSTSKTNKARHMPITPKTAKVLAQWKAQNPASRLVFPSKDGKVRTSASKAWGALMESAGIADFNWHDLRHDYASVLVMRGTDLYTTSKLMGHSSTLMTEKYAHLAPEFMQDAVSVLDKGEDEEYESVVVQFDQQQQEPASV